VNLLIVSVDSLRRDYVSRVGSAVSTPHFDRVTRDFLFHDTCFSVSSVTRPVHVSLFSGLYPFEHGIEGQQFVSMRRGTPLLFEHLLSRGYRVGAFSEAATVFRGLDLGQPVEPLALAPRAALAQLEAWMGRGRQQQSLGLFAHYWSTHAPYGAADGLAMGETADLIRTGRVDVVRRRYVRAVEETLDQKVAPLIQRLDPSLWCVVILADHGESWTPADLYHGQSLSNAVLRVPFYLHIPHTGNPPLPHSPMSLVDVFPTLASLLNLPVDYEGFGIDLRAGARAGQYLAEVCPTPAGRTDLIVPDRSTRAPGGREPDERRLWAIFNGSLKFTWDQGARSGRLERTLTEDPVDLQGATARQYCEQYERMRRESRYAGRDLEASTSRDEELLQERLRGLGYLE